LVDDGWNWIEVGEIRWLEERQVMPVTANVVYTSIKRLYELKDQQNKYTRGEE
jgi:hypothetical protein